MNKVFKTGVAVAAAALTASVVLPATAVSADSKTVTVGIVGTSDKGVWEEVAKTAKKKYGITIKTKVFTDYNQPNKAVADGSLDLNSFQHYYFLENWNKSNKNSVKAIGKTFITPIRLYSEKYKSVKKFKKGDAIAVPNDATNEARALTLLQSAGLITLKKGVDMPTVKDIKTNKLDLDIKEVAADQTTSSLKSVDGAVINTNYAQQAKLKLSSAIYVEPVNKDSKKWINIIAASKKNANKKIYKQVVKAYQTKATKDYLKKTWGQAEIPAWDITLK
ncbi:MetQ/NlpA family ABC transporter substrate-binding protein [Weissella confusa]|uniref:MetQ/NlpA family ABC transporter substrate-binding protein n=1 Tax=Weissella confusa TaxID=1583 RepID=UPI000DCA89D1|nr:MetQ/NlpA family ABC transporter substrate-binding protein [Weissella confusa]MBD5832521.1 MetQ/NlpA family ABC transporter substrate-binding protein [Weissella confusa]MBJ7621489.1 MetQ/NlpA family ABC transporter substrate-binding protein [Weissella confusa]MBJ7630126.1 MetQ/NlpA family ABC transporter substrate-binding protein [Weissella confusa]MBJ7634967.1 MetQ/NlpA family ABC transporter substrate-binding protein [Weissella confusa]RAU06671.1 ABC transporter substrate-binding protein 